MPEFAPFGPSTGAPALQATVRCLAESDVRRVASLHAVREGVPLEGAVATVSSWLADDRRLTLVAEHDQQVQGYASATFLDVHEGDGLGVTGWHLTGVVVNPAARRRGLGMQLTSARLDMIEERSETAWYFVNAENRASIALHTKYGFVEHARGPRICGVEFSGGTGILFRLDY
ncbi:GNAT family N-acetyltransferase [Nocardioides sp. 616]|uniref:GNAT family N-acetyltransferase n=1 Tax=Nocardioides sp. 616 TaxID=2268090 RepID=UPI0013B47219|nr:GNAT family N-acetyltransferase [Nocardioides sp. 616]